MKTRMKLFFAVFATFLLGAIAAPAAALPAFVGGVGLTAVISLVPSIPGAIFTSVDITELNTALGAYFRKDANVLIREALLGMDGITDRMDVWDDVKDEVPLPNLSVTDLIKPANATAFSPTSNALKFGARMLKARAWKVDLQIVPQDLVRSWLGKYSGKGSDPHAMPLEQYIWEYVQQKIQENLRLQSLFKGVYNGAGTTPVDVMDGILKIVADEITATNITPVATGAVSSANVIEKIEATYDALGEAYKSSETQALVSPTLFDWYVRQYRATYGGNNDYTGMANGSVRLDGTMCTVKREPGLGTSQRIIVCTPDNITYGVDSFSDANTIKTQEFDRTIKVLIDAKSGVQFKEIGANALAVNDQA